MFKLKDKKIFIILVIVSSLIIHQYTKGKHFCRPIKWDIDNEKLSVKDENLKV